MSIDRSDAGSWRAELALREIQQGGTARTTCALCHCRVCDHPDAVWNGGTTSEERTTP